jgi:hypothetical protein
LVDLGYDRIINLSAAVGLSAPTGTVLALILPENGNVRWRADGSVPTGTVGTPIWGTSELQWGGDMDAIHFINMTDSNSILNITYFGIDADAEDVFLTTNNAISTLDIALVANATTVYLKPGSGALFPQPGNGEYFSVTLSSSATFEILKATSRDGDVLTVTRAQEGTTARDWPKGTLAQNLLTAGQISQLIQRFQLTSALILDRLGDGAGPIGSILTSNGPDEVPTWENPMALATLPPPGMVDLGFEQLSDLTNPVNIPNVPDGTLLTVITPQDGNIRWRADGIAPDGDVGNIIWATADLNWVGVMNSIQFINMTDSTATVSFQFYGIAS